MINKIKKWLADFKEWREYRKMVKQRKEELKGRDPYNYK